MIQALGSFCDLIAALPISHAIQDIAWIIPMVQAVHIISVSIVVGSVIMIDTKLLGLTGADTTASGQVDRYTPWIWSALAVLFCTGLVLICGEPRRELLNVVFLSKMALIVFIVVATIVFQKVAHRHVLAWGKTPSNPMLARGLAAASLIVWVAIIACGRWIAYVAQE